jgi:hypothetical protein
MIPAGGSPDGCYALGQVTARVPRPSVRTWKGRYEAGCKVWHKDNLLGSRVREMMDGLPVPQDLQEAPEVFRYLGRQAMRPAA